MWINLFVLVIVIVVVWWLITNNAKNTKDDQSASTSHHEHNLEESESHTGNQNVNQDEENEDDLTMIEGIGPKISECFKTAGIKTFRHLSQTKPEDLKLILTDAGIRLGDPTSWPNQANLAADGKFEELSELQKSLKGGRTQS